MKKIAFALIALMLLIGGASAYLINADCPDTVYLGEPLVIEGTSTLPAGFSTDIILYKNKPSIRQIERKTITIQGDGSWTVTFQTSGLETGQYNLQVQETSEYSYGSASTCTSNYPKIFEIVDRSQELEITSPLEQSYDGELTIAGSSTTLGNTGIEITVTLEGKDVYGPEYIPTDSNGAFSVSVPINSAGSYEVNFADSIGSIATYTFTVQWSTSTTASGSPVLSASSSASAASPAYFAVDTKEGTVTVTTSTGVDWVLEYLDETGQITTVNQQDSQSAESARISAQGGVIYLKVYPASAGTEGTVTVTVANASTVTVSRTAATLFGDDNQTTETETTPLSLLAAVAALSLIVIAGRRQ